MAVQMEWMFSGVVVVQNDLNNLILVQDERVGICTIHGGIGCILARREDGIKGRDFWRNVGNVVESSTAIESVSRPRIAQDIFLLIGSIIKINHCKVESDGIVCSLVKLLSVQRYQSKVIKWVESSFDLSSSR